jgi:hypothetical protein
MHMNSLAPISIVETPMSLWKWGVAPEAIVSSKVFETQGD